MSIYKEKLEPDASVLCASVVKYFHHRELRGTEKGICEENTSSRNGLSG